MQHFTRIKELRLEAGYTQKEMADMLSVSERTYRGYENGEHTVYSDVFIKLTEIFNVTCDYLAGISDDRYYLAP